MTIDSEHASPGENSGQIAPELLEVMYDELRVLAERAMRHERANHTLQPTALVNEAYMRLADQDRARLNDREHFLAVAAQAMRRILVDHARGKGRKKRGGDQRRAEMSESLMVDVDSAEIDLLELEEALTRLAEADPRKAQIVELKFFGGLSEVEIAGILGVTDRTVRKDWSIAKTWLYHELHSDGTTA